MLACGKSIAEIAEALEVKPNAVRKWKQDPRFQVILARYEKRITEESLKTGIALKSYRLEAAHKRHQRLERVIEARAKDAANPNSPLYGTPGAEQGVMVAEQMEIVGEGENARPVATKIKYDAALLKELRELEVFADKETEDKATGPAGNFGNLNVLINFPTLTVEEASAAVAAAPVIDIPSAARRMLK